MLDSIRVCAQQLGVVSCGTANVDANPNAHRAELNQLTDRDLEPGATADVTPRRGGGAAKVIIPVIGGGAAAAAIAGAAAKKGGGGGDKCGPSPAAALAPCFSSTNRPTDCNARQARMEEWCSCNKKGYDRGTGSCR